VSEVLTPIEPAAAVGVAGERRRYRERAGLLVPVARDAAGRRRYSRGIAATRSSSGFELSRRSSAVAEETAAYEEIA